MSLAEVIIAILIFSSGTVAAVSMMIYTLKLAKLSEHHVVASNLARSGLELLRSKRDSNWLYESGNIRQNWNFGFSEGMGLFYTVDLNDLAGEYGYKVLITSQADPNELDLSENLPDDDLAAWLDPYQLYLTPGPENLYTHEVTGNIASRYYRQIKIVYEGDKTECEDDEDLNCNYFYADSTVFWIEQGKPRRVTMSTKLYDWYQRSDKAYYEKP